MSDWYDIKAKDIRFTKRDGEVNINFGHNNFGERYITIPLAVLLEAISKQTRIRIDFSDVKTEAE